VARQRLSGSLTVIARRIPPTFLQTWFALTQGIEPDNHRNHWLGRKLKGGGQGNHDLEGGEPSILTFTLDMDGRLMRNSALTLLVLALLANTVSANDEIKRLLADLSFGDVMSADDKLSTSDQVESVAVEPVAVESVAVEPFAVERVKSEPVAVGMKMPVLPEVLTVVPVIALPPEQTVKAVLKDPIPDSMPLAEVNLIDVTNALPAQIVTIQPREAKSVGHRLQNQACETHAYQTGVVCRPRVSPNLPTSTFLQYFRGNPCYSNAWDGYGYECGPQHAHLHGECDCFKGKNAGCESCDSKTGR
jgi:hypothetical protein